MLLAERTTSMPDVLYVTDDEELDCLLTRWLDRPPKVLGYDLETTGLDPVMDKLLLVQLSDGTTTLVIDGQLPSLPFLLRWILEHPDIVKVAHHAKFEYQWTKLHLRAELKPLYCTQLGDTILRCGLNGVEESSSLRANLERYLHRTLNKELQTSFVGVDPITFTPTPEQLAYAAEDARCLLPLYREQQLRLRNDGLLTTADLEMRALSAFAEMELAGIHIDKARWEALLVELREELAQREIGLVEQLTPPLEGYRAETYRQTHEIRSAWDAREAAMTAELEARSVVSDSALMEPLVCFPTPAARRDWIRAEQRAWKEQDPRPPLPKLDQGPINLGSHQQLTLAFQGLGVYLTDTKYRTLLEESRREGPHQQLLKDLITWKQFYKLENSFGDNVLARLDGEDRLHPEINQLVKTGRTSFRRPNLQQIPGGAKKRGPADEFAARFRDCFTAPVGRKLICADYASIEFRICAELANEVEVLAELAKGAEGDPHSRFAALANNITREQVTPAQRFAAKTLNYGRMYGLSLQGFADQLGLTPNEAEPLYKAWDDAHPRMNAWLHKQRILASTRGETRTPLGRRRLYERPPQPRLTKQEDPLSWAEYEKTMGGIKRAGSNAPIQGCSADILKIALCRVSNVLNAMDLDAQIVNYIHDELVVEADEEKADLVARIVEREMVEAARTQLTTVAIEVEVKVGDVWSH
jgi:DNA polymerase I-like protein with 3'-5' exonuclease and polymerase domains